MYYQDIFLLCPYSVTSVILVLMLLLSLLILLPIYVLVLILSIKPHTFPVYGPVRIINSF